MTFTIDTNIIRNLSNIANPGALIGGILLIAFIMLAFKFAAWGDSINGRSSGDTKNSKIFLILLVILAIVTGAVYGGQSTGHTELITGSAPSALWG